MTTLTVDFDAPTVEVSDDRLRKLRIFNAVMGTLHLVSGTLMLEIGRASCRERVCQYV